MGTREDTQSVLDATEKVHRHASELAALEPMEYCSPQEQARVTAL